MSTTAEAQRFSGKELLGFHRFRIAEQVEEWVSEALTNLIAAKKLCRELERKNMIKTKRQREMFDAMEHLIQCALEAGHVPMLQFSTDLLMDFGAAFEDGDEEGDNG
jgi:hypothetical protein